MKTHFASFGTKDFIGHRDALCASATKVGFDNIIALSPADYNGTNFHNQNKFVLSQKRGAGYWLWKPWLIRKIVKQIPEGDVLAYCDSGRNAYYQFRRFPAFLVRQTLLSTEGYLLGPSLPQHGPLTRWTKRDALVYMDADSPALHTRPLIQAGWSFWSHTVTALEFLDAWIAACEDPRCLTDINNTCGLDNYSDFLDHRHDQSILTLLAYQRNSPYLEVDRTKASRVLRIRPNSRFCHYYLRRIDDAELLFSGSPVQSILTAYQDILRHVK